ncbi:hypothetical protein jhhlp_007085, partial [Lomentospora prolificans]
KLLFPPPNLFFYLERLAFTATTRSQLNNFTPPLNYPTSSPFPPLSQTTMATDTVTTPQSNTASQGIFSSQWSSRYRGATVQDLDPPAALSLTPSDSISHALISAFEREYTHLTVVSAKTRSLLGYVSIPNLQRLLDSGAVSPDDDISAAMTRFQRKGTKYTVITMATPLEDLEAFFRGEGSAGPQNFAVITDEKRRFVLGVATVEDLEEFAKRRPA